MKLSMEFVPTELCDAIHGFLKVASHQLYAMQPLNSQSLSYDSKGCITPMKFSASKA